MDLNNQYYSRKRDFAVSERRSGIFGRNTTKGTALMTPEVLRKTFKNMDMEMLLVCRLVCKTWSREATYWVQKLSACIQLPLRTQSLNEEEHTNSILKMEALKKCIDQSSNWPLTKLKYSGFKEDSEKNSEVDKMVVSVMTSMSPWITDISLNFLEGRKLGDNVKLRRVHFTNLENFKVEIDKTWTKIKISEGKCFASMANCEFQIKKMEDLILYVIQWSNVEKVDFMERGPERQGMVLHSLLHKLQRIGFGRFTKLHIATYISNSHLYYLSQMGPKLTELSLTFLEIPEYIKSGLVEVFQTFATSLVSLKLSFQHTSGRPLVVLNFPKMEKLEYLAVNIGNNLNLQAADISYSDMFPKLKSLSLSSSGNNLEFMLKPCQTLEKVELHNQSTSFMTEGPNVFPNVKFMTVDIFWLRKVSQYWPNLEELQLDVAQHENLEFELACVDYKTWQILKSRYQNGESIEIIQEEYQKHKAEKTLTDLKKLKVLRLKPKSKGDSRSISELICRLIFMKMESLKCLDFCGGFQLDKNMSSSVLENMRERLSLRL